MRDLLFLAHRIPYPPDKGEKIRAWHMFQHLARRFRVHLGCFVDDPDDAARIEELRPLCADLVCVKIDRRKQRLKALLRARPGQPLTLGYFHDAGLQHWVDATLARHAIDHVFVYSSAVAHFVMHATARIRVLDMVDVDSAKWSAYAATARFPSRLVFAREARTLLDFERRAARAFTHSIFVSEAEWRHFVSLAPEARATTSWVSNGVDLGHFSPDLAFPDPFPDQSPGARPGSPLTLPPAPFPGAPTVDGPQPAPRLVFTGRMDYRPNRDAVVWFARTVLPMVRARWPGTRFAIVGAAPAPEVHALAALPGVIVTGRVPDTRPWLAYASVVVAPMLIGRGIQNKVLEGMAMARPVVATPEAFEGVQAMPERDILLASGVEQTVDRITDVLSGRAPGLGAAARRAMEANHDWSATLAKLDALFPDQPDRDPTPDRIADMAQNHRAVPPPEVAL